MGYVTVEEKEGSPGGTPTTTKQLYNLNLSNPRLTWWTSALGTDDTPYGARWTGLSVLCVARLHRDESWWTGLDCPVACLHR